MIGRGERTANYVILIVFATVAVYPLLSVLVSALGAPDTGTPGPGVLGLHPENFAAAWREGHFATYLRASVAVSVTVVLVSVVLSILSGYALGGPAAISPAVLQSVAAASICD